MYWNINLAEAVNTLDCTAYRNLSFTLGKTELGLLIMYPHMIRYHCYTCCFLCFFCCKVINSSLEYTIVGRVANNTIEFNDGESDDTTWPRE